MKMPRLGMRSLAIGILLALGAALCEAQSMHRVVLGPQYRYNDSCAGPGCNREGIWGSNSVTHAFAGDSIVCTKASDGAQYCIADDTSGANYSFGLAAGAPNVGANAALIKITGSPL